MLNYLGLEQEETWKPVVLLWWYLPLTGSSEGTPRSLAQQTATCISFRQCKLVTG